MNMHGKKQTKEGAALPKNRLFGGEGWKPLDPLSARQQCAGVKRENHWDHFRIPSNGYYSDAPIPIQPTHGRDFSGSIRGHVVIVGFFGEIEKRRYWVTNCECGIYELISEKTLATKPHSPRHCCASCRLNESKRYHQECADLAEQHGLDYDTLRAQFKAARETCGKGKRNSFGLLHFIRNAAAIARK